jgi:AraC-like DNA-binding protein
MKPVDGYGTYGQRIARHCEAKGNPSFVARILDKTKISVTELRDDDPITAMTKPLPPEDAFVAALVLRDYPNRQYWEHGRPAPRADLKAGDALLYDLRRDPMALIDKPFHSVHIHLPRLALDSIADDANVPRIDELAYQPGAGIADPTFRHLTNSLIPALAHPEAASKIFIGHVTLAIAAHVARAHGGMQSTARPLQGGLAPWQERRAKDLLTANLKGDFSLEEIARECSLSVSYFSRAFRRSMGVAPYRWVLLHRVERAKSLLMMPELALSDIALQCGFADQSHFTRTFAAIVGSSPGYWRRQTCT